MAEPVSDNQSRDALYDSGESLIKIAMIGTMTVGRTVSIFADTCAAFKSLGGGFFVSFANAFFNQMWLSIGVWSHVNRNSCGMWALKKSTACLLAWLFVFSRNKQKLVSMKWISYCGPCADYCLLLYTCFSTSGFCNLRSHVLCLSLNLRWPVFKRKVGGVKCENYVQRM